MCTIPQSANGNLQILDYELGKQWYCDWKRKVYNELYLKLTNNLNKTLLTTVNIFVHKAYCLAIFSSATARFPFHIFCCKPLNNPCTHTCSCWLVNAIACKCYCHYKNCSCKWSNQCNTGKNVFDGKMSKNMESRHNESTSFQRFRNVTCP